MKLLRALRLLLLLSVPLATSDADESANRECSSGWRSLNEQVIRGEGQASIALQCRKNEKSQGSLVSAYPGEIDRGRSDPNISEGSDFRSLG